jgi:uncharacterized protein
LREVAATVLDAGHPVIVDAAMLMRSERDALRELAARLGVRCECVWCEAPLTTLRSRIARRQAKGADASDATLAVLDRQRGFTQAPAAAERVLHFDTRMTRGRLDGEVALLAAGLRRDR